MKVICTRSLSPVQRLLVGAMLGTLWLRMPAAAQDAAPANAEQTLDREERISIAARPMSEALQALSEKTHLKFQIDPETADLLPYGPKSIITITVQNMTMRRGLTLVFEGLGMRMRPVGGTVQIIPAPFLERMNRRLTKNEQEVVYGMAKSAAFSVAKPPAMLELRVDGEPNAGDLLAQKVQNARGDNAIQQLEAATDALSWSWRLADRKIVIERRRSYFLQRLNDPLNVSFTQRPLQVVVAEILQRAGVPLAVENEAFQTAGVAQRKVDLITRRPAVKLLELMCQGAGLEFEVTDAGVVIRPASRAGGIPVAATQPAMAPPAAEEMVDLLIEIRSGVWASVRMARSKIPADLKEALEKRMREVFGDNPPSIGRGTP